MATVNIEFKPSEISDETSSENTDIYVDGAKVFVYGTQNYFDLETIKEALQNVYNLGYSAGIEHVQKTLGEELTDRMSPEEDGWIAWYSDDDLEPVDDNVIVEVMHRDRRKDVGKARVFWWQTDGDKGDIVAYRVVGEGISND